MPDPQGRILNYSDAPLTARGRAQAQRIAGALDGVSLDAVVTSDIARAAQTAEIVAAGRLPVHVESRMREVDLGEFDGQNMYTLAEVDARYLPWPEVAFRGRLARLGYHVSSELPFPGGESARTLAERSVPALVDVATTWAGASVAVVTHGWTIQALLCHITATDVRNYYRFSFANASITLVEVDAAGRGAMLLHNADLDLGRATNGRLAGGDEGGAGDLEGTCRLVTLCAGGRGDDALAAELDGARVAAVRTAPDAASRRLADAVAGATGIRPESDSRLAGSGAGGAAPGALTDATAAALGSAVVLVAEPSAASRIGLHVLADGTGGATRLPALPGGLGLAEVEADGRGTLHIWNGRIGPGHVPSRPDGGGGRTHQGGERHG